MVFEKYKPRGLFSEFYGTWIKFVWTGPKLPIIKGLLPSTVRIFTFHTALDP